MQSATPKPELGTAVDEIEAKALMNATLDLFRQICKLPDLQIGTASVGTCEDEDVHICALVA